MIADPSIWSRKGVKALECTRDRGFLMELEGTLSLEWLSVAPIPFSLSVVLGSQLSISVICFMLTKLLPFGEMVVENAECVGEFHLDDGLSTSSILLPASL